MTNEENMLKNRLQISDIQTNGILYYDEHFKDDCLKFCELRNIDCLPATDNHIHYFKRHENGFERNRIPESQKVKSSLHIFDPAMRGNFEKHHVLFVFTHNELTGIVHFADYGREPVSLYLYSLFFEYERVLRQLLALKYTDEDMLDFFKSQAWNKNLSDFNKSKKRNPNAPSFQHFSLKNLIQLLNEKENIGLDTEVYNLRNQIMHTNELIDQRDITAPDYVYEYSSFDKFFGRTEILFRDLKQVKSRLNFLA